MKSIKQDEKNKYLLDTSVIINQKISELIKANSIPDHSIIIVPTIALRELEHQANRKERRGYAGLEELQTLQDFAKSGKIELIYEDVLYTVGDVTSAKLGSLDDIIVKAAIRNNAILITADRVQSKVAAAQGCKTYFYDFSSNKFVSDFQTKEPTTLSFEEFFNKDTLSIHLIQDSFVFAKIRKNKKVNYIKISKNFLSYDEIKRIHHEIKNHPLFVSESADQNYILGKINEYRIIMTTPPLSVRLEIIVIKQRTIKTFAEYKISKQHTDFLINAKSVIIASEIGGGKTSFARALFFKLSKCGTEKVAKILESQPEQIMCENINQYNKSTITTEDLKQLILSSRTDELLFDEIKTQEDVKLFADLRLANITTISTLNIADKVCALHFIFSNLPFIVAISVINAFVFLNKDGSIDEILVPKINIKNSNLSVKIVDLNGNARFECFKQQNELVVNAIK
ncbi:MAG: hypothetical protein COW47_01345 [Candidatus Huberarchaeum crystalense]|uniref:PIN domain-containing protein n=1 Tax=Huberarchaeum crystalense TaxID=2014257 RepID=A0A2G9LJA4_HUBC1|nr:PIN domain-containing protein [archaeon]OIP20803.1 MAG: hypothetical protein AUJ91_00305 [archaeon CG2_30_31_98]PIN66626.1 MAG: hypothetical protein COW69_01170 [Candidatus Huberarchaeum crystalense]NCS98503.1 PIN domain-containing protein [archaeon]PIV13502.1 MAG: hypothetical protein COS45_02635 [Candidatus Huberarchaeum crystalense]